MTVLQDPFDCIIIGAGIGGLVCGCCLAKAGMKVLIADQHFKPGGYCTSFRRNGFTFDAAAHSFGGYRSGNLGRIFKELSLDKKIRISKCDPSDVIQTARHRISIWSDPTRTREELKASFPEERNNVHNFFDLMTGPGSGLFPGMRRATFRDLLDRFFADEALKQSLSFPLYGNGALPASRMTAYIGMRIFTESVLDGGYFPENGMQELPDALAETFREHGGELRLSCGIGAIKTRDGAVSGVMTEGGEFLSARLIVSNCDASLTFSDLLESGTAGRDMRGKVAESVPSLSMFILYLGMDRAVQGLPDRRTTLWRLADLDIEKAYSRARNGELPSLDNYILHYKPDRGTLVAFLNAPYGSSRFWQQAKQDLMEKFIRRIEQDLVPSLSDSIRHREAATPHTLFRYTRNRDGAAYGWESIPSQFADHDMRKPPFIRGLHLTGHWTTLGHGIPGVTYLGWDTACTILKKRAKTML